MAGHLGPVHWLILAVVIAIFFGGVGRPPGGWSALLTDAAKGVRAFRDRWK